METAQLTEAILKKIDAFQIKGLRNILGRKHTYWDRSATNYNIIEMASRIVNQRKIKKGKKKEGMDLEGSNWERKKDVNMEAMNTEVLKDLWIKEDTDWNVEEVFENQNQRKTENFSQSYLKRKHKLMGHVIRADYEEPL